MFIIQNASNFLTKVNPFRFFYRFELDLFAIIEFDVEETPLYLILINKNFTNGKTRIKK